MYAERWRLSRALLRCPTGRDRCGGCGTSGYHLGIWPTALVRIVYIFLLRLVFCSAVLVISRVVVGIFPAVKITALVGGPGNMAVYRRISVIPPTAKVLPPKNEKPPTAKTLPPKKYRHLLVLPLPPKKYRQLYIPPKSTNSQYRQKNTANSRYRPTGTANTGYRPKGTAGTGHRPYRRY